MAKTKNNHYLSQCISINFVEGYNPKTFWEYNPTTKEIRPKNINRLFAKRRAWGQGLESVIADDFENKLGPILKKYAECKIQRGRILGSKGIAEVQFNGFIIQNKSDKSTLSKLLCQTLLLQKSNTSPDEESESKLSEIFHSPADFTQTLMLSLFEVNPRLNCPPLVLLDGMTFVFLVPENDGNNIGHIGFMFPISESRLLLWTSRKEDMSYFAKRFMDIHSLNLSRINQHDKKGRIASANREYLSKLIQDIDSFTEQGSVQIKTERTFS